MSVVPPYLRPALVGWVALGGMVGTLARDQLESAYGAPAGAFPWVTLAINVSGAFLLGLLVQSLARLGPETRRRRAARLCLGTGLLGGFTTYSTFVLEAVSLGSSGAVPAVAYVAVSVIAGFGAALAGHRLARRAAGGRRG